MRSAICSADVTLIRVHLFRSLESEFLGVGYHSVMRIQRRAEGRAAARDGRRADDACCVGGRILVLLPMLAVAAAVAVAVPGGRVAAAVSARAGDHVDHAPHARPMERLRALSGAAFERTYLSMMIPHHEAAVTMARDALARATDRSVRVWADHTLLNQTREIERMRVMLRGRALDSAARRAMEAAMAPMARGVRAAADPERAFVDLMIPHHALAVEMATLALQRAGDARVLALSRDIVMSQAQEIYEFRLWPARR
jgi:uncharacterized protein (DUF305 family)